MSIIGVLLFTGCASKEAQYYQAVKEQNQNYLKAYSTVKNETVSFNGTFKGDITVIKPKKLPQLLRIQKPKSSAEIALDWGRLVIPAATSISGLYYGYKAIDSSNRANTKQIEAYTGNFQNSTTTSEISNISDTSVTDKSVTNTSDTSVTDKSVTDTTNDTSVTDTTSIPSSIAVDSNSSTITR